MTCPHNEAVVAILEAGPDGRPVPGAEPQWHCEICHENISQSEVPPLVLATFDQGMEDIKRTVPCSIFTCQQPRAPDALNGICDRCAWWFTQPN